MNEIRCPECGSLFSIDESSYASNVLNATAKLIVVYGDALNDEVFKEKVGAVSIKAINQDFVNNKGTHTAYFSTLNFTF